ncbi:MAG: SDR family oxidoreductase [Chloroflexota bacterium]|nr:SDR family oxidoreductase [Chloroflexota bacterium]
MAVKLKQLADQVMVITGASSGIGLVTARMAAERGAKLVLAARSEVALRQLTEEIERGGGQAVFVVADVGEREQVRAIAQAADDAFGGFDTWVNNAGISIYGTLEVVPIDEMRLLFETNLWGVVYGSLEAAAHLKERGGALINVGSALSNRAVPLQGIYAASKHAVKGFTDALRMELEKEGAPVSVTLIKPGPIDTPFTLHAKNYMEAEPKHVPPVYAPETVARAILHAAETPVRDIFVGGGGKGPSMLGYSMPRLTDRVMRAVFFAGSKSDRPAGPRDEHGLDRPSGELAARGNYEGYVAETSPYTTAALHPVASRAALVGAGAAALVWWRATRHGR